jgi:hypothetical protein
VEKPEPQEYLARVALVGEIVWFWQTPTVVRAALVTYCHREDRGGGYDLAVFESAGFRFVHNRKRGRHEGGWTTRGAVK